ncbi:MAG: IseA DL-endopeptidase inhibitor family protein [Bacteroides sp.]|nr:IseA DL-endopeptidase inhibitor family protein [Bacteroides sp.]
MKKKLALIMSLLFTVSLFSSCDPSEAEPKETQAAAAPEAEETTARVSAVEDQPENTSAVSEAGASFSAETAPPDGFPAPYPSGAVEDDTVLSHFKEIITAAETANSVLYGKNTLIPLKGTESGGYRLISPDYAADVGELTERMYEGFKYSFWEDKYGDEVENMLPELVLEVDNGIMLSVAEKEAPVVIDVSSAVLTELNETTALVTALGTQGDRYIWRTYDMLNGVRGWVVRMYEDETVTGEIAVFSQLLIDKGVTLNKIFGNAKPVTDENGDWNPQLVTIENDVYGHGFYNGLEIEPFMTVEEMRQFMRDTFTSEIAESYIKLYINRTYVEKDGRLYIINGSILPQTGEFSLASYENRAISSFDVTSAVEWTDGENTYTVPVTIAYEDGLWKLDTRLPMREDRVIWR